MASSSIHSARSFVNNYEVVLLETTDQLGKKRSSVQLQKCFKTFDEIIPMLGQYQRVMKLIRDDIYEAVFSRDYTVGIEQDRCSGNESENGSETSLGKKTASIERVPHFVILNKIMDERNKKADDAEEETERLKVVLGTIHEETRELKDHNDRLENVIDRQNVEIQDLRTDLANNKQENARLVKGLNTQHEDMANKTRAFEDCVETLNEKLSQECTTVTELMRFKKCHDDVQDRFRDPSVFSTNPPKALFSANEQKLRRDIDQGKTLEKQLLKLRNTCINEFDDFLEKQVSEEKDMVTPVKNRGHFQNEQSFELKTEERRKYETSFVNMIANIENELEQNKQHLSLLKADLDKLNEIKRESHPKVFQKLDHGVGRNQSEEDESRLLEMVKDSSVNYRFLPQEPILNKYAITAFYSCNQGKTFHELQHVQHCKSCGQKTLVCPHKVSKGEKVFHLPLQSTHIKFSRPGLHIPVASKNDISDEKNPTSVSLAQLEHSESYARLWNDLASREGPSTQLTQSLPRVVNENFLVSLIKQFYDSIVWGDFSDDEESLVSLLDLWYAFMNDRYQVPSVVLLVAKDVLEAIAKTVHSNRFVQLFAECMCGNLDPAVFRYYQTLSQLVKTIKWTSKEDFVCFVEIAYPFMNAEDLEQFAMNYTSFSENKISGTVICRFLLYIILKQREPSFHEMENTLVNQYAGPNVGFMTDVVFFEAMAEISPLSSEPLCHRLFAQSKADSQANHVSISRLAQIGSFLHLYQRTAVMEMQIDEKLQITEDWSL